MTSKRTTALVAVAVLLIVEVLGIVASLVWGFHSRSDASETTVSDSNRSAAVAAAEQFALRMDDFQAPSAEQYESRIEEMLTTKGKADFAQVKSVIGQVFTATQPTAKQSAAGTKAPTGRIVYSGVSDIDSDSATVLVAHDAGVNGSNQSLHFRWTVTLKKIGKTWLVDDLPPEVSGSQAQ